MSATTPSFSSAGNVGSGTLSAANTATNGTGTIVTLLTGAANGGCRIERIWAKAAGTTTAGMLRYFLFNASGTFVQLLGELTVSAATVGATVQCWEGQLTYGSSRFFILPENFTIRAATYNAETFTTSVFYTT